jgi:hypothetical protein
MTTKKPKPPAFARWRISLLKWHARELLGHAYAPGREKAAIEAAGEGIQDRRGAAGSDRRAAGWVTTGSS